MGNTGSTPTPPPPPPPEPIDNQKLSQAGYIIGIILLVVVIILFIIVIFKFSPPAEVIKETLLGVVKGASSAAKGASSTGSGRVSELPWGTIIPVFLGIMSIYYFSSAISFKYTKGKYRANLPSSSQLIIIQQSLISNALSSLSATPGSAAGSPSNGNSVCNAILTKQPASFGSIVTNDNSAIGDARTLLNWRPLTVRLPGYLNGEHGPSDGVFEPAFGIDAALTLGARGFFFDIDYEDAAPCIPFLIFRDNTGIKRSLNNGNIAKAIAEIASKAFVTNNDPVLIIIYLRRIPPGRVQKSKFFGEIASALNPLSDNHLGQTDKGNFHNCRSESTLFTSPITDYQKKFIVITNYDTSQLPTTKNPKDNLAFWTNARIYQDPSGISVGLGTGTPVAPAAPPVQAQVGHIDHLLNIGTNDQSKYQLQTSRIFSIAIGSPDYSYTPAQVGFLLNTLGIQCLPLDVIGLGISAAHIPTIAYANAQATNFENGPLKTSLNPMYNMNPYDSITKTSTSKDILSFWTYTGWSMKMINSGTTGTKKDGFQDFKEGFEETAPVPGATPIPGFIIPKPVPPKEPSPKMNSNGGLVTIN
jgi:hypothetical protein